MQQFLDRNGNPVLYEDGNEKVEEVGVEVQDLDENGNEQYIYSLRYEEFIAIYRIRAARK